MTDFLDHNLAVIREVSSRIADMIRDAPAPEGWTVGPSASGSPTLEGRGDDGRPILFHSRHDPRIEAQRQVTLEDAPKVVHLVLIGMGLGHSLKAACETLNRESRIFILEPHLWMVRLALGCQDFESVLRDPRVRILVGEQAHDLYAALRDDVDIFFRAAVRLVLHQPSARAFPEVYRQVRQGLEDFIRAGSTMFRTVMVLTRKNIENCIENLADYVVDPGVAQYAGVLAGRPAAIIAAGPSLWPEIDLLREVQDRIAVLAVSTTLKTLLAIGIRPHFTFCVDYHVLSRRYFEDIDPEVARRVPLITDARASHEAVQAYPGPHIYQQDIYSDAIVPGARRDKGYLEGGATVAHFAFNFARYAGADPIILLGQDLSYPHGTIYVPGTPVHQQWRGEVNRFNTFEMRNWEYLLRRRPSLLKVESNDGGKVYTDDVMLSYLRDFTILIRKTRSRVLHASRGAARIEGAQVVSFRDVVADLPTTPLDLPLPPPPGPECNTRIEAAIADVEGLLEQDKGVASIQRQMLGVLRGIRNRHRSDRAADDLVRKVQDLRTQLRKYERLYFLLSKLAPSDELARMAADRALRADDITGIEKQKRQTQRDLHFVEGMSKARKFFAKFLPPALDRLRRSLGDPP